MAHADPGQRRLGDPAATNQRDMDRPPVQRTASTVVWPVWVQRCGIGSSCNCAPEQQRAAVQRGTQPAIPSGGAAPRPGDRLLAHELAHVLDRAGVADAVVGGSGHVGPGQRRDGDPAATNQRDMDQPPVQRTASTAVSAGLGPAVRHRLVLQLRTRAAACRNATGYPARHRRRRCTVASRCALPHGRCLLRGLLLGTRAHRLSRRRRGLEPERACADRWIRHPVPSRRLQPGHAIWRPAPRSRTGPCRPAARRRCPCPGRRWSIRPVGTGRRCRRGQGGKSGPVRERTSGGQRGPCRRCGRQRPYATKLPATARARRPRPAPGKASGNDSAGGNRPVPDLAGPRRTRTWLVIAQPVQLRHRQPRSQAVPRRAP